MNSQRFERIVRSELELLLRLGVIDEATGRRLFERYPDVTFDWTRLGRWFAVFGAISAAAGALLWLTEVFEFTLQKLAGLLALVTVALFAGGWHVTRRGLTWTGRGLELFGGLTLIGLSFTIGAIIDTGSGNWPAVLLVDLVLLLPLAYLRRNVLLLILALVVFFVWFGGVTGYASGWGVYWFGMNYPLRFLLAGLAIAGVGTLHRVYVDGALAPWREFFKVWLSAGVFFSEMALWLMSLFGNFGAIFDRHLETAGELLFFNVLWAGFNLALLVLGARFRLSMLRAYAMTYLIIQAYTLFFWHVAGNLGPVLSTFLAGSVTLWGVYQFEQRRRRTNV